MIIRFQYLQSSVDELSVKALIKITNASVNPENALAYLMTRYPDRHNIEIIEIIIEEH
ncbi:hypothetical protein MCEMSE6_03049 [Oxalobacteraceae bacterium]